MIKARILGHDLELETGAELFSPAKVDAGTLAMLSMADFQPEDKVLDLGCGYGVVGIAAAKQIGAQRVTLCDLLLQAVQTAHANAQRNGVDEVRIVQSDALAAIPDNDFTLILSNPPYQADFSVPKRFIEQSYAKLAFGGRMLMVTKRKTWYANKLTAVFGGVQVRQIDGYYIFIAQKRARRSDNKPVKVNHLSKKLQKREDKWKRRP